MTARDAAPGYRPGACNIGPAEIAMRRRLAHAGSVATTAMIVALVRADAPRPWRLLAFLPATGAAAAYLEVGSRFCLAYGWRGVFNLDRRLGQTSPVDDAAARGLDRRRALAIGARAVAVGAAVTLLATAI